MSEKVDTIMPRIGSFMKLNSKDNPEDDKNDFTPLMQKAMEQMEFYFTGYNLEKDKYLYSIYNESENHMINISVFMKFNRIQQLEISEDDLLFACSKSKRLVVDASKRTVGRLAPFKKDILRSIRTLRITGIPDTLPKEDFEQFLSEYGDNWVTYQYSYDKAEKENHFNGIAIVEFEKEEDSQSVLQKELCIDGSKLQTETIEHFENRIKKK